jgi:metallophosphoesterase superfamily enzyme
MILPAPAAESYALARGVTALPGGVALLDASRVLLCADAHFGYEDVMGGALPLWSTGEVAATIAIVARRHAVREIIFLGDLLHGSTMSEGAVRAVQRELLALRAIASLTFIAGNHEGRTRGRSILGDTVETCERDGWHLIHGDRPARPGMPTIIGHLHPSVHFGGTSAVPAFLAARDLVVVPALTPYSTGLDVLSDACLHALAPYGVRRPDLQVVAATADCVYPFGTLSRVRDALRAPAHPRANGYRRRHLRADEGPRA